MANKLTTESKQPSEQDKARGIVSPHGSGAWFAEVDSANLSEAIAEAKRRRRQRK